MADHTYDPFGTRYEVDQYRPPLGGFDPVAAWGPRGAAAMLASHAFARGAGRIGGLDLLSRAAGYPENAPSARWSDISATLARLRQFDWGHAWNMSDDRDRARRRLGISEQTPVGARLLLGGGADFPIIEGPRGEQYRDGGSTPYVAPVSEFTTPSDQRREEAARRIPGSDLPFAYSGRGPFGMWGTQLGNILGRALAFGAPGPGGRSTVGATRGNDIAIANRIENRMNTRAMIEADQWDPGITGGMLDLGIPGRPDMNVPSSFSSAGLLSGHPSGIIMSGRDIGVRYPGSFRQRSDSANLNAAPDPSNPLGGWGSLQAALAGPDGPAILARMRGRIAEGRRGDFQTIPGGRTDLPDIPQRRDGGSTPLAALDSLLYRAPYDDGGAVGKRGIPDRQAPPTYWSIYGVPRTQPSDAPWALPEGLVGDIPYRYQGVGLHGGIAGAAALAALRNPRPGLMGLMSGWWPIALVNGLYAVDSIRSGRTAPRAQADPGTSTLTGREAGTPPPDVGLIPREEAFGQHSVLGIPQRRNGGRAPYDDGGEVPPANPSPGLAALDDIIYAVPTSAANSR